MKVGAWGRIGGALLLIALVSGAAIAASPVQISGTVEAELAWTPSELWGASTTFKNVRVDVAAGPNLSLILRAPWEGESKDSLHGPYTQPKVLSDDVTLYTLKVRGAFYEGGQELALDAGHVDLLWGRESVYRFYRRGIRLHRARLGRVETEAFAGWDGSKMKPEVGPTRIALCTTTTPSHCPCTATGLS